MNALEPLQVAQFPTECDSNFGTPGKEAALFLFGRRADNFRKIVRRLLSNRLRSFLDPDDLLQEVAVVLLSKPLPESICSITDLARYVGGVTRNMVFALNRKHVGGQHHRLDHEIPFESVPENEVPPSAEPSCGERLREKEALANLQDWLPLQVRAIATWICAGYSVAEVAACHGIDEEMVINFVRIANNLSPHPERKIGKEEVFDLFKPHVRARRKKTVASKVS